MRSKHLGISAIAATMALQLTMAAEKQTVTIAAPLQPIAGLPLELPLTGESARDVVDKVLAQKEPAGGAVMLNAVTYLSDKPAADRQDWYTVDLAASTSLGKLEAAGDFHGADEFKRQRIYGASTLGLVYLHILQAAPRVKVDEQLHGRDLGKIQENLKSSKDDEKRARCPATTAADKCLADVTKDVEALTSALTASAGGGGLGSLVSFQKRVAEISAKKLAAANLEDMLAVFQDATVETAIQGLLTTGASGQITLIAEGANLTGRQIPVEVARLGTGAGYFVVKGFSGLTKLTYTVEITSKEAAPFSNLKAIIGFAFGAQSAIPLAIPVELERTAFAAGGIFETAYTTSDMTVSALYTGADSKDVTIGPVVYDNEKRYWYDFSLVLPIKSYNDLTYDSTANGLSARQIKKNNLYAALNVGLPRDTKRARFQYIPVLLYGVPISGQPLKHHLFAATVGLNYVNFFVGVRVDQKNFYHDFSKPLNGGNVFQVWRTHLSYGLNFDPQPLIKSLSGKK
jgi:hypothetical protein